MGEQILAAEVVFCRQARDRHEVSRIYS